MKAKEADFLSIQLLEGEHHLDAVGEGFGKLSALAVVFAHILLHFDRLVCACEYTNGDFVGIGLVLLHKVVHSFLEEVTEFALREALCGVSVERSCDAILGNAGLANESTGPDFVHMTCADLVPLATALTAVDEFFSHNNVVTLFLKEALFEVTKRVGVKSKNRRTYTGAFGSSIATFSPAS